MFAVIYVITMISVHKPAKLAAAVSPMEALRYTAQDDMKKTANKKMCRNLTPLGLGVMNFSKNKKESGHNNAFSGSWRYFIYDSSDIYVLF